MQGKQVNPRAHLGLTPKVIPIKLFLDKAIISSANVRYSHNTSVDVFLANQFMFCFVSIRFVSLQSEGKPPTLWEYIFDILCTCNLETLIGPQFNQETDVPCTNCKHWMNGREISRKRVPRKPANAQTQAREPNKHSLGNIQYNY